MSDRTEDFKGHTPGPWRAGVFAVFAGERTIIANLASRPASTDLPSVDERLRNCDLMAAAPDLLAELDALRERCDRLEKALNQAAEALSRARVRLGNSGRAPNVDVSTAREILSVARDSARAALSEVDPKAP